MKRRQCKITYNLSAEMANILETSSHTFIQGRSQQTLSLKGQLVDTLAFVGHTISAAATKLSQCETAIDSTSRNGQTVYHENFIYKKNQALGDIQPTNYNLLTPGLEQWCTIEMKSEPHISFNIFCQSHQKKLREICEIITYILFNLIYINSSM